MSFRDLHSVDQVMPHRSILVKKLVFSLQLIGTAALHLHDLLWVCNGWCMSLVASPSHCVCFFCSPLTSLSFLISFFLSFSLILYFSGRGQWKRLAVPPDFAKLYLCYRRLRFSGCYTGSHSRSPKSG